MKNNIINVLKITSLLMVCVFVLQSCSKDENQMSNLDPIMVTYRIIGSEGVIINMVTYQYAGDQKHSGIGYYANPWISSEIEVTETPTIAVNATGVNAQSTLRTEILVNGQVVSEGSLSTGTVLSSTATYNRN